MTPKIRYGGDYNPEQWPQEVWDEDHRLFTRAGIDTLTVGVFTWSVTQPGPDTYDFTVLDRILDRAAAERRRVCLATGTAALPPWLARRHPEVNRTDFEGRRHRYGQRHNFCPSSPAYREHATALASHLAERYADRPALLAWHINNEYGGACYCDLCAGAFREWLRDRHGTLDALNDAWWTTFWSHRYTDWDQIEPPSALTEHWRGPDHTAFQGITLDWFRFTTDALLGCFLAEKEVIRAHDPDTPVTTNFMTALSQCDSVDYWAWGREVDLVTNDHYLITDGRRTHVNLAMAADLTRSVAGGAPWLLLEHSTSGVNWQLRNPAKAPGQMARNSLAHVARGSEGALFFQWRQSRRGAEKFHSAMVPHGGTDTRVWREVVELGASVEALSEIRGTRTEADVAMLWDWHSWWAQNLDWRPSVDHEARERADAFYEALYDRHLTVDFAHPEADVSRYPLVVVPALYLMTEAAGRNLKAYVENGGTLVVSYFSGIVDEHDAVHEGAYPGPLRDVLGLTVEEFSPLLPGERVRVTGPDGTELAADVWTEFVVPRGAETVLTYADGLAAGLPAVTRHRLGEGTAWYVSTRLGADGLDALLGRAGEDARLAPRADLPRDVEVVRRTGASGTYLFAVNHTGSDVKVPLEAAGTELLTGEPAAGRLAVPAGAVRVVRLGG